MKNITVLFSLLVLLTNCSVVEDRSDLIPKSSEQEAKSGQSPDQAGWGDEFEVVEIESPLDGVLQAAYFYKTRSADPQPLIVSLHTWSNDYTQHDSISALSLTRDYNYIHPNFRGINNTKEACCSELVISDIDASIDYALRNANVDNSRIYVIGMSGGGYATLAMFMKSKHQIRRFSSWVPLVDLVQWFDETRIRKLKYADEILACTESENGILNEQVAKEKSPFYWETPGEKLAYSDLEIYAGIYDGMTGNGVIPVTHSINFYNKLLMDLNVADSRAYVSESEKLALLEFRKPLGDFGSISGRKIVLVKEANNVRLTLFEGGHEMLTEYAFEELTK